MLLGHRRGCANLKRVPATLGAKYLSLQKKVSETYAFCYPFLDLMRCNRLA